VLDIELCHFFLENNKNKEQNLCQWIKENKINVLNIAGNRESFSPGIEKRAYEFLISQF